MAELSNLIVQGPTKMNGDVTASSDIKAETIDGRTILTATSKPTPSPTGTGIVTENYLYWLLS